MTQNKKEISLCKTGDNISMGNANWEFSGNAVKNFRRHIKKSIPLYDQGQDLICQASDFFLKQDSTCYEIGCSLGDLLLKLVKHNVHKPNIKWYGIDSAPEMIKSAKNKFKKYKNVSLENTDINTYEFQKSDLIVSYYCIQFIHPKFRQQLISRIYDSLEWGGAFMWFEKVRAPDARFQDIATSLYTDFKLKQGYTPNEIIGKSKSLKGILDPFSTFGNMEFLRRAGFVDITTIMKYVCFEGFLAIK